MKTLRSAAPLAAAGLAAGLSLSAAGSASAADTIRFAVTDVEGLEALQREVAAMEIGGSAGGGLVRTSVGFSTAGAVPGWAGRVSSRWAGIMSRPMMSS